MTQSGHRLALAYRKLAENRAQERDLPLPNTGK